MLLQMEMLSSSKKKKRILLIDEVDVFFSKGFYGSTLNPVFLFTSPEIVDVLRHIWTHRDGAKSSWEHVQRSSAYARLKAKYYPRLQTLFDAHIRQVHPGGQAGAIL